MPLIYSWNARKSSGRYNLKLISTLSKVTMYIIKYIHGDFCYCIGKIATNQRETCPQNEKKFAVRPVPKTKKFFLQNH